MQAILDYLKLGGDRLDTEIAAATGMSLDTVRVSVTDLHARGEVMVKDLRAKGQVSVARGVVREHVLGVGRGTLSP